MTINDFKNLATEHSAEFKKTGREIWGKPSWAFFKNGNLISDTASIDNWKHWAKLDCIEELGLINW